MENSDQIFVDGLSGAAVMLAIVAALYTVWYPDIAEMAESKPLIGTKSVVLKRSQRFAFVSKAIPLLFMVALLTAMMAPYSWLVMTTLDLRAKYDFVRAIWVAINIASSVLTLSLSRSTFKLVHALIAKTQ